MGIAGILQLVTSHIPAVSILWQLPQYALAMITDYIVVVSSLEYLYEGKTKWPRAGCTAAFFALQGVGVLGGTLLALALSKGAQHVWTTDVFVTPALALLILLIQYLLPSAAGS
eukprot:CAMPEP_0173068484 /NCGR_PEP_ID=MMETSP1102-20130122/7439_1 /TAXON_ID=49646 /ORGANISM="Geminigera sp., Strain Caron Lab Isolate" /LENGTH=113 /DNA_ID=CAMNT_0013936351 /DNA_START=226 /DNA_END=567 /DNA_ORIENTATION=+